MNERPNYYAIIPANIRYSEVSSSAKLLYGEITALCNERGYCWASNSYFSELYRVHVDTISDWVTQLNDLGFIKIEDGKGKNRKISLSVKTPRLPRQKDRTISGENTEQNNTSNNTISKDRQLAVVEAYKKAYQKRFGNTPKLEAKHYVLIARRLKEDGDEKILAALDFYFSHDEERERRKLAAGPDINSLLSSYGLNNIYSRMPKVVSRVEKELREKIRKTWDECKVCKGSGRVEKDGKMFKCSCARELEEQLKALHP